MKRVLILIFLIFLAFGSSIAQSDSWKISQLTQQAQEGDVNAMCDLGLMYYYGKDVLKDPFQAKCWIKLAYDGGSNRAKTIWNNLGLWQYSGRCDNRTEQVIIAQEYYPGDTFTEPFSGMEFTWIPKGCFRMGCQKIAKKCDKDEKPAHGVCLDGFWVGIYEVTQEEWYQVMNYNPSNFNKGLRYPVENVSFEEVQKFCILLTAKNENKFKFRMPTEAEWEYACSNGGQKVIYPWDDYSNFPDANCGSCNSGNYKGETSPVGSFPPNQAGLFDMGGNVKEWCQDVYSKVAYSNHIKTNPVYMSNGKNMVVRGGSWLDNTLQSRCSNRSKFISTTKSYYIGARIVMEER